MNIQGAGFAQARPEVHRRATIAFPNRHSQAQTAQKIGLGGGDLLQHLQDEVAQVPNDQISGLEQRQHVGGSGLVVAPIRAQGKLDKALGQQIVARLNFEHGSLGTALIARTREPSGQFLGKPEGGAVLQQDPAEVAQRGRNRPVPWGCQRGQECLQDRLQKGGGSVGHAFEQSLFAQGALAEQADEARPAPIRGRRECDQQASRLEKKRGRELLGFAPTEPRRASQLVGGQFVQVLLQGCGQILGLSCCRFFGVARLVCFPVGGRRFALRLFSHPEDKG